MRGKEIAHGEGKTRTQISHTGLFKVPCVRAGQGLYQEIWDLPNMF